MKIIKKIRNILIAMIYFVLLLVLFSEKWFLAVWDSSVDFSTVVYQLFSPLKGTGSQIIRLYITGCICPVLLIVFFSYVIILCMSKIVFVWEIRISRKEIHFALDGRCRKIASCISLVFVACIICSCIWMQAVEMGMVDYVEQITNSSYIFEEEYIDPRSVAISFPEEKRNLILIYLESMETTFASVEEGGGKPVSYIPELAELARESLFFSDDEDFGGASSANGTGWTMAALLGSSTGAPYKLGIEGNTADAYEKFLPGIISLGDILLENGYRNYFMCGSDITFGGRKDFYLQHGDYTLVDFNTAKEEGFIPADYDNEFWGMEDEKLFTFAKEKLSSISAMDGPFNFTLLTVDTHHVDGYVCDYCETQYDQQYANVLACSSRQVAAFVKWIQEQPWYENTTIVITGDHLSMKNDFWDDIGNYERKIYNCFVNLPDGFTSARTKNRTFSVLDMFPSILAAMEVEIEGDRLGLGVNLFSEEVTIPEKMGMDKFNLEIGRYSSYYFQHFIVGK